MKVKISKSLTLMDSELVQHWLLIVKLLLAAIWISRQWLGVLFWPHWNQSEKNPNPSTEFSATVNKKSCSDTAQWCWWWRVSKSQYNGVFNKNIFSPHFLAAGRCSRRRLRDRGLGWGLQWPSIRAPHLCWTMIKILKSHKQMVNVLMYVVLTQLSHW